MSPSDDISTNLSDEAVVVYLDAIIRGLLKKKSGTWDELLAQIKLEYEHDLCELSLPATFAVQLPELHVALVRMLTHHLEHPSDLSMPSS